MALSRYYLDQPISIKETIMGKHNPSEDGQRNALRTKEKPKRVDGASSRFKTRKKKKHNSSHVK